MGAPRAVARRPHRRPASPPLAAASSKSTGARLGGPRTRAPPGRSGRRGRTSRRAALRRVRPRVAVPRSSRT
eukprot:9473327-Pyramimonas_sp.AAC.1